MIQIKTFTDKGFNNNSDRIEKLDKDVNAWLKRNDDVEIIVIQRNEDGNVSYVTVVYDTQE